MAAAVVAAAIGYIMVLKGRTRFFVMITYTSVISSVYISAFRSSESS